MRSGLPARAATAALLATFAAASPAYALPPGNLEAERASMTAVAAAEPGPAVPTFENGLSQAVFSTNAADWHSGEVWVQAPFDSDGDGRLDRIHADFTAPRETPTAARRPAGSTRRSPRRP